MKRRLVDLEAAAAAVRPFLSQYLQEHGINTEKNFRCLNPKHEDKRPSMTMKQDPERAFCMSCSTLCDIFTAAHFLEGKPARGKEWIEENLLYLAKKYGVQVEMQDLTADEIYEWRTYAAYRLAAELVADPEFGDYSLASKEITRREWDPAKLANWGIGTVNFNEFRDRLKKAGFEPNILRGTDLDRSNLFNENNLIFTVYDDLGRPVGFSARNLKYDKDNEDTGCKFNNTKGTGLTCNIFKKSERLYGFDIAKEAGSPLYVFEGQADVITARHFGLMNCCCMMCASLSDHHVNLLKKHGAFNIVLVFDGDPAGRKAIEKAIDEKFSKHKDFRIKLIQLPDGTDPDRLLREEGISNFTQLKKWTAFEWRLSKLLEEHKNDEDSAREIAEKMTPIIAQEEGYIRQEDMCKQVAKMTGYTLSTITAEVKRLRSAKEAKLQARRRGVVEAALDKAMHNPDEAEVALAECQIDLENIKREVDPEGEGTTPVLDFVLSQKEKDENKTGEFEGYLLRPEGLGGIGYRLNGDWKKENLIYIGGVEQTGKTTLASQMAYEIASNPKNNAIVIYLSIDDAARSILYKWVCQAADNLALELNHIASPKYWRDQGYKGLDKLRERGYKKVVNLIKDGKLILKDATNGGSLLYIESLAKHYRSIAPDQNVVLIIDNFHKIFEQANERSVGHERTKKTSNQLKKITTIHNLTVIATAEYRKQQPGEDPSNVALAESRALSYDATVILHLYNDLHSNGEDKAILVHKPGDVLLPRVRCQFGKNKVAGYEGREFLDFFPASATMKAIDLKTAMEDQMLRLEYLKGDNKCRRS